MTHDSECCSELAAEADSGMKKIIESMKNKRSSMGKENKGECITCLKWLNIQLMYV
jgi:hypothetical protein